MEYGREEARRVIRRHCFIQGEHETFCKEAGAKLGSWCTGGWWQRYTTWWREDWFLDDWQLPDEIAGQFAAALGVEKDRDFKSSRNLGLTYAARDLIQKTVKSQRKQ